MGSDPGRRPPRCQGLPPWGSASLSEPGVRFKKKRAASKDVARLKGRYFYYSLTYCLLLTAGTTGDPYLAATVSSLFTSFTPATAEAA